MTGSRPLWGQLVLACALTLACASPQVVQRAPSALVLLDLAGQLQHPSLARGHPLLLHFGATW